MKSKNLLLRFGALKNFPKNSRLSPKISRVELAEILLKFAQKRSLEKLIRSTARIA
jgi:hypothetical protein